EPSPESHKGSIASPVKEDARAPEAAWNPAVLGALQHVERLPESDSTDHIKAIPGGYVADVDRCRPSPRLFLCPHWGMRVASCCVCEILGELVEVLERLFSRRQSPIEDLSPCQMRFVVGRHLHAPAAIRSPVKKAIELVTFEDVGFFGMDFLEG
ncbi:MAG: hypothetical protein Q9225_008003, partial [Loekoesia sp. 1 TL-2023]